jgi:hypothetical protein
MATIPKCEIYIRSRLHYDIVGNVERAVEVIERISDKALALGDKYNVRVETNTGGPCWGPYITIDGERQGEVERAYRSIAVYIASFKHHTFTNVVDSPE